jgi:hypothetical protein
VVNLSSSSDEGDLIVDVSRDEKFTRRFLGDLNCDFLGPPGDGKIIILSVSDEKEEEVRKEKVTDAEAALVSAVRSPAPIAYADDASGTDKDNTPDRVIGGSSNGGDEANLPYAVAPKRRL